MCPRSYQETHFYNPLSSIFVFQCQRVLLPRHLAVCQRRQARPSAGQCRSYFLFLERLSPLVLLRDRLRSFPRFSRQEFVSPYRETVILLDFLQQESDNAIDPQYPICLCPCAWNFNMLNNLSPSSVLTCADPLIICAAPIVLTNLVKSWPTAENHIKIGKIWSLTQHFALK